MGNAEEKKDKMQQYKGLKGTKPGRAKLVWGMGMQGRGKIIVRIPKTTAFLQKLYESLSTTVEAS